MISDYTNYFFFSFLSTQTPFILFFSVLYLRQRPCWYKGPDRAGCSLLSPWVSRHRQSPDGLRQSVKKTKTELRVRES